jgi:hypothetical protein
MKTTATLVLTLVALGALAGERFVSTIGTVQKEIAADRLAIPLDAGRELGCAIHPPPSLSAAVAHIDLHHTP